MEPDHIDNEKSHGLGYVPHSPEVDIGMKFGHLLGLDSLIPIV
jgi:hypothetical protein